jgi:hypothetical protein
MRAVMTPFVTRVTLCTLWHERNVTELQRNDAKIPRSKNPCHTRLPSGGTQGLRQGCVLFATLGLYSAS